MKYTVRINFIDYREYSTLEVTEEEVAGLKELFLAGNPFIITAANNQSIIFPNNVSQVVITPKQDDRTDV